MSYVRYANRTCHNCGAIHPQNEMNRTTVTRESGRSKKTFSILDGNNKRRQDALWGLGGRTYYSKKEVWECDDCSISPGGSGFGDAAIGFAIIGALLIWALGAIWDAILVIWDAISGYVRIVVDIASNNTFMDAIGFISLVEIRIAGFDLTHIFLGFSFLALVYIINFIVQLFRNKETE